MKKAIVSLVVALVVASSASAVIVPAPGDITQLQSWNFGLGSAVNWLTGAGQSTTTLSVQPIDLAQTAANTGLGTVGHQTLTGALVQTGTAGGDGAVAGVAQNLNVPAGTGTNFQQQFVAPGCSGLLLEAQAVNFDGDQLLAKTGGAGLATGTNAVALEAHQDGTAAGAVMCEDAQIMGTMVSTVEGDCCGSGTVATGMVADVAQSQLVNGYDEP